MKAFSLSALSAVALIAVGAHLSDGTPQDVPTGRDPDSALILLPHSKASCYTPPGRCSSSTCPVAGWARRGTIARALPRPSAKLAPVGATGFIGTHVGRWLVAVGEKVTGTPWREPASPVPRHLPHARG